MAKRHATPLLVAGLLVALSSLVAFAAIAISTTTPFLQDFNTIGTSATATLPADFRVDRTATSTAADVRRVLTWAAAGSQTTQAGSANLSTSAANGIYNFGVTAASTERAIGFLASGTATASGNLYAELANNTGAPLSGLSISYNVEKYRNGSNANGFRIQLFWSDDGIAWTSAGSAFMTAFPADANNNGFAVAPGATVPVSDVLNVTIQPGANFYLAWNYSVTAGNTVTNAQALAVDDISILGLEASNPSGAGIGRSAERRRRRADDAQRDRVRRVESAQHRARRVVRSDGDRRERDLHSAQHGRQHVLRAVHRAARHAGTALPAAVRGV